MKIILLTDYKGNFGSKWNNKPYRSGMDKLLLKNNFNELGYEILFIKPSELSSMFLDNNQLLLYTSSEDVGYYYKDFIEDIVLGAEQFGLKVIPQYKYLRANNNKVFMELLKKSVFSSDINNLASKVYGALEEVNVSELSFPIVIKEASGAMSDGVYLADNKKEFFSIVKKVSRTVNLKKDIKDFFRQYKHKGYVKESLYRKKFIVQDFIPGLKSDFKLLIFGDKYYIFERPVRKNDFRASGSGSTQYVYGSKVKYPKGIFDFAKRVYEQSSVPHLSVDIAFDGSNFYVIEFQALFFGTVGLVKSDGYYSFNDSSWSFVREIITIEKIFVDSINYYILTHKVG